MILIQRIEILRSLYNEVVVPRAVINEMLAPGTPAQVIEWTRNKPAWVIVTQAAQTISEILIDAARRNMIDLHSTIADLRSTNCRISQQLLDWALENSNDLEA